MRATGTAGGTDRTNDLALADALANAHVKAREVQEIAAEAEAVVDHDGAAGQVQIGIGKGDQATGRGLDRSPAWRGDIHARMRGARLAVVDALVAETSADAPCHRAHEGFGEIGAVIITIAHGGDGRLLAADALGNLRRRI